MYKKRCDSRTNRKFSNKGQVTVFIILGIVLVLVVALVIILQTEVVKVAPGKIIPSDKEKVERFITSCIEDIGEDALFAAGLQGGYVEVPQDIAQDGSSHLKLTPVTVVPYWAYGTFVDIPTLDQTKVQVDRYIEDNLRECVFGDAAFQETFNFVERTGITADTVFSNGKTTFNVEWELEIRDKVGKLVTELLDHVAESQIKFKTVYETAKHIVNTELSTLKFEDLTQDLLALEHPDVPQAGYEFSCTKKRWRVDKTKESLQNLLRFNIAKLQVAGTNVVDFPDEFPYYQNHYIWDVGEEFKQEDVTVTFGYQPNYPFQFQVTPADGTWLQSGTQGGNEMLSKICIQMWKFTYDVHYPVLTQVRDDSTDFIFNTAFMVHLTRNVPNREDALVARDPNNVIGQNDEEYCADKKTPLTVLTNKKVDSPETGVSFIEPLEEVEVSFTCLQSRCEMGNTTFDFDNRGYQAGFTRNFPYCVGAILRAEKSGFKEDWERVVVAPGKEVELFLTPLYSMPVQEINVVRHEFGEQGNEEISDTAVYMINLKSIKKGEDGKPFHESTLVTTKDVIEVEGFNSLEFLAEADFTYDLEINVFEDEKFVSGYKGNWTVAWAELEIANSVTFHTVGQNGLSEIENYEFVGNLAEKSKGLPAPELK